ncbi:MAG: NAD(P)H-dependent oxidoreductase [Yoonia sp.]|uniref:NADPH-dependent FMN reductase n=1 Tax=Yoonia sp. TaxID=2212373 RepID=UPI00273D359D|nr:NADPH-dependent FMN reductase [Yoonia sp.]MDP5083780.1 NAD(P)H-dependent oxidoreductase [Yoonia sp.]MDP5362197.1 NAD(P)H-dependent oxidoreductase [Paracoccaceae bacterium]
MTTLLGISGSLRKASTNTMLMRNAAAIFGADEFIEADINLPLYNGDLEDAEGIPATVQKLADQIAAADAVIIATPEYNKALSGVLKNALDWVSRTKGGPWKDKPVAIMSAAAGRAGGERSQFSLRLAMTPFRPHILQGPEVLVANSAKEFDENGKLTGEIYIKLLTELMEALKARI